MKRDDHETNEKKNEKTWTASHFFVNVKFKFIDVGISKELQPLCHACSEIILCNCKIFSN